MGGARLKERYAMKKVSTVILIAIFFFSIIGNLIAVFVVDRALHYREVIQQVESRFINHGLHLERNDDIRAANIDNLGVAVGGSLVRFWLFPRDYSFHLVNQGGIEEKIKTTFERLDDTVVAIDAKWALINSGFCEIHTAIHTGRDVTPVIQKNLDYMNEIILKLKENHILPIITTLTPVRPIHLLGYLRRFDIPSENKKAENRALNDYNNRLRSLAQEKGLPLIDLHKAMADMNDELIKEYSLTDGEHLNYKGYEKLSQVMEAALKTILN